MPKRIPDMITTATARKVKNMSVPELIAYLFAIYSAGCLDGLAAARKNVSGTDTET